MDPFPYFFFGAILLVFVLLSYAEAKRRKKFQSQFAVREGVEYPNNHHVLGVGFYHAASAKWFPHAWNEFQEGRGYYWDGTWYRVPDQRMVTKSMPSKAEVDRVNNEWRKADPDRTSKFWMQVEQEGFGTAIRRSEGS
jgi:hypothetical protein